MRGKRCTKVEEHNVGRKGTQGRKMIKYVCAKARSVVPAAVRFCSAGLCQVSQQHPISGFQSVQHSRIQMQASDFGLYSTFGHWSIRWIRTAIKMICSW